MAKIISGPDMQGSLGDLSVFTNKRGQKIIRQKGGPSKEQIRSLPSCAGMRDSITEFGHISNFAGSIRKAFGLQAEYFSDGSYFNRLMGLARMISDTDVLHERGRRTPVNGNIYLLEGFQWNKNVSLNEAPGIVCRTSIEASTAKVEMEFASFSSPAGIPAPPGATHFQLIGRGCVVNGRTREKLAMGSSEVVALNNINPEQLRLSLLMDVDSGDANILILGAGILFFEEEDGLLFGMRGKGAFTIASIERIKSKSTSKEERQTAIQLTEQMMEQCKLVKKKGLIVFTNNENTHVEMVRAEKSLWRKKLERLKGG